MITKHEWQAANQQLMAGERRRLGDSPMAEVMLAYTRGELSPDEEEKVREWLACNPDLARTLTAPFPTVGAREGDPDFLGDADLARHLAALHARMGNEKERDRGDWGRVVQFWRYTTAAAAMLAVVMGALLWQTVSTVRRPHVWEEQVLLPDGVRGPADELPVLSGKGESIALIIPLIGYREFERYRIGIVDRTSGRAVWSGDAPSPREDNKFALVVPRRFLPPGTYRIAIHGFDGTREETLSTYSLRVPDR